MRTILFLVIACLATSCTTQSKPLLSRELNERTDIVWINLVERLDRHDDEIIKIDSEKKTVTIRRVLHPQEIFYYAASPSGEFVGPGEAEINLYLEPLGINTSLLRAKSEIYALRRASSVRMDVFDVFDGAVSAFPDYLERSEPVILESNGLLELEYLGYSRDEARRLQKTAQIQKEFQGIKSKYQKNFMQESVLTDTKSTIN